MLKTAKDIKRAEEQISGWYDNLSEEDRHRLLAKFAEGEDSGPSVFRTLADTLSGVPDNVKSVLQTTADSYSALPDEVKPVVTGGLSALGGGGLLSYLRHRATRGDRGGPSGRFRHFLMGAGLGGAVGGAAPMLHRLAEGEPEEPGFWQRVKADEPAVYRIGKTVSKPMPAAGAFTAGHAALLLAANNAKARKLKSVARTLDPLKKMVPGGTRGYGHAALEIGNWGVAGGRWLKDQVWPWDS